MYHLHMDHIGHEITIQEAYALYRMYCKEGWIPMTPGDIQRTANVSIGETTLLCFPDENNKKN